MEAEPTQAYNQDDATDFIRMSGMRLNAPACQHGK